MAFQCHVARQIIIVQSLCTEIGQFYMLYFLYLSARDINKKHY